MRSSLTIATMATVALIACGDDFTMGDPETGGTGGTVEGGGGAGASGAMGGGGTGGAPECMTDVDCTEADKARCDAGTCVPCTISTQCEGVAGLPVCDGGTCIECMLGEEDACTGGETCDLLAKECVAVAENAVDACESCTNDVQCAGDLKCIPLDYPVGTMHGYSCLEPRMGLCPRPYVPVGNKTSLSGEPAATYCGTAEDLATCEAVLALQAGRFCTVDGMCSETMGGNEFAVPGALCRELFGAAPTRCTYECGTDTTCPQDGAGRFCGNDMGASAESFCGGDTM